MAAMLNQQGTIGERTGTVLFSQWDQFSRLLDRVCDHPDLDAVHDLRVASRRLRATVAICAPFVPAAKPKRLGREFRQVTRGVGRLRNLDEALAYLDHAGIDIPETRQCLVISREGELRQVLDGLNRFPRQKVDRLVRRGAADLAAAPEDSAWLADHLTSLAECRFRTLRELLSPALEPANATGRHALRIALKKWRYLLETAGAVCGRDYGPSLELLKEYQTLLGSLNDLEEFGALFAGLVMPEEEQTALAAALGNDAARNLALFLELASRSTPQYTFIIEVNP